ncbi:MAG: FIST signal transduction protein [Silvanigrellaceae bacterium]
MKVVQAVASAPETVAEFCSKNLGTKKNGILLAFGSSESLSGPLAGKLLAAANSNNVLFCSTSGHFAGQQIQDEGLCLSFLEFEKTNVKVAAMDISNATESEVVGEKLANLLKGGDLRQVLVFSDGLKVNGTALANGLTKVLEKSTIISGGLAGDGSNFKRTLVGLNSLPKEGCVAVVGFYGNSLETAAASMGGWDAFGPKRVITKSEANVLWELDGKPALEVYKQYLGKHAAELPASALLFPLSVSMGSTSHKVVRTVLSIDDKTGAMTFAGDLPVGSEVQLMKSNIDSLVSGAQGAAEKCELSGPADFALLVSCVGRRLVMGQRTEEEIEIVQQATKSPKCAVTGFYSYGELSPQGKFERCDLHNQTMTVTMFRESH